MGGFCGKRNLPALTQTAMRQAYGCPQADVMVLFGGSILAGGDVLAQAIQNGAAKKFMAIPHNSKCRYGERGAADAKPKAQIILDVLSSILATQMPCRSIILCQDATMQRRMEMGLRKYRPQGMEIINYAAYQAEVVAQGSQLIYREAIPGMWAVDRYVNLLMGGKKIPRLTDNDAGCAPNGKNYIAHDDIPPEVRAAFERLQAVYGTQTRAANPLYASK